MKLQGKIFSKKFGLPCNVVLFCSVQTGEKKSKLMHAKYKQLFHSYNFQNFTLKFWTTPSDFGYRKVGADTNVKAQENRGWNG